MSVRALSVALAALMAVPLMASDAQARRGPDGWGMRGRYQRYYNPKTVKTITGQVTKVERIRPMRRMATGIHITVKTADTSYDVHLGPAWYIDKQKVKINKGDTVDVMGSLTKIDKKDVIIAAKVTKKTAQGDEVLQLRDDTGRPMWAGKRGRGPGT